jgi:multicomponent Na+:H+ antiporter subunit F
MMESAYLTIAVILLLTLAGGLFRIVRGPSAEDRMLAAQLFGTTGVAVLLVLTPVVGPALRDVALVFILLAALNAAVFVRMGTADRPPGAER